FHIRRLDIFQVEGMGTKWSFDAGPACRRIGMIKMRDASEKAFASVLFFERAFGQCNMRLARGFAANKRKIEITHKGIFLIKRRMAQGGSEELKIQSLS